MCARRENLTLAMFIITLRRYRREARTQRRAQTDENQVEGRRALRPPAVSPAVSAVVPLCQRPLRPAMGGSQ